MTNYVTYQVALTPENAALIDELNAKLIAGYNGASNSAPAKTEKAATSKTAPAKTEKEEPSTDVPTMAAFKAAAKTAKEEHGEDFAKQAMTDAGVDVKPSLGRSLSAATPEQYQEIMDAWVAGPAETEDEGEDDDFGDDEDFGDDDEAEVTPEAVKTALKAYAKDVGRDEAREIMQKHGAASLSKVDGLSAAKLAAMLKELV